MRRELEGFAPRSGLLLANAAATTSCRTSVAAIAPSARISGRGASRSSPVTSSARSDLRATRNSGHTTGLHLHLEVMDFPDRLRANGLPFVSKTFRVDSPLPPRPHWSLFSSRQAGRHRFNPGFTGSYQHDVIPLRLDVMNSRPRYCQSACCTER